MTQDLHVRQLRQTADEIGAFLDRVFPAEARAGFGEVVSVELDHARLSLAPTPAMLRPGEIVSGPTLMGLIDVAGYAVILAHTGLLEMILTTTLSINFLRPCRLGPVFADARLLKLGRQLAVVDVRVWQGSEDRLVAQSTVEYALPRR